MVDMKLPRPGEVAIELPEGYDAQLHFIGRIRTPWPEAGDCPKNSRERHDAIGRVEIDPRYVQGLKDIGLVSHVFLIYWLHRARRDLIIQAPSHAPAPRGVFALRSPVRPNPIGLSVSEIVSVGDTWIEVRNIDCADATPLIDIKPYFATTDSVPHARRP